MTSSQWAGSRDRAKQVGVAAVVGGVAWLAWEAARRTWADGASSDCSGGGEAFSDVAFALANLSVAAALILLFSALHGASRWFALAGSVASVMLATGNTLEHCVAEPFSLMYILAAMVLAVTLVGTSATLVLSRQLRWWQAVLPALSVLLGMMLSYERGGAGVIGLTWLAFGASMITMAPIRAPSPALAR